MNIRKEDLSNINKIGIYCITNLTNGKKYIGKTGNKKGFICRWRNHKNELNRKQHRNNYLQMSWNKYGEDSFEFSIHEIVNRIENKKELNRILNEKEQYWIEYYDTYNSDNGYNLTKGGEGCLGLIVSDKTKQKQSEIKKILFATGKLISPNKGKTKENYEPLRRISEKLKGRKFSKEHIENNRQAQLKYNKEHLKEIKERGKRLHDKYVLGEIIPINKGKTKENYEPLKRVSEKLKGHLVSEETRQKVSNTVKEQFANGRINGMIGRQQTEETRQKISDNHYDCKGIKSSQAIQIIQLDLEYNIIKIYGYIKETKKYGYDRDSVNDCINHKYPYNNSGPNHNIYKGYIWLKLSEYLEYLKTNDILMSEMLIQFFKDNPNIENKYNSEPIN